MPGMLGHCSWRENVDLVDRQLVTLDEVPGQSELEMRAHPDPGKGQESYGQLASTGEEPVRMELESCDRCLASSEDRDHAFEGCHWDLDHEDLGLDEVVVVEPMEEHRLENCLDLGEA